MTRSQHSSAEVATRSISLAPDLPKLGRVFRARCSVISRTLGDCAHGGPGDGRRRLAAARESMIGPAVAGVGDTESLKLAACLSLVLDLVSQGWRVASTSPDVLLAGPDEEGREGNRERVRAVHLAERDRQLRSPAVGLFLRRMEARRLTPQGWHSIFSLMRDGRGLRDALERARLEADPDRARAALSSAIQPYLQAVTDTATCPHTGLSLAEVWRYFRFTWVTAQKSVPGRSMRFLVRDAAAPNHPVMGIACLASSVAQQSVRDQWIGWDGAGILARLLRDDSVDWGGWALRSVGDAVDRIYVADLIREGLVTRAAIRRPGPAAVQRLLAEATRSISKHRVFPRAAGHKSAWDGNPSSWLDRARTSLFRAKRARQLASLLGLRAELQQLGVHAGMPAARLRELSGIPGFRRALGRVARLAKAERVGANMMDISVCGAVPPYGPILGGKLVCLLMCSPEVTAAYRRVYRNRPGLIASSMSGRSVRKSSELVLLCTTSLYGSKLNQYSRVRIPAAAAGGRPGRSLAYEFLGESEGFGSFQFGADTLKLIETILGRGNHARKVNSIFGEGVNPLMRKVRDGLAALGLPGDEILRHGHRRAVYGVPLASNFREVLLGLEDRPDYLLPQDGGTECTEAIAQFWRERWLAKRIQRPGIVDALARHTCERPIAHGARVGVETDVEGDEAELFLR